MKLTRITPPIEYFWSGLRRLTAADLPAGFEPITSNYSLRIARQGRWVYLSGGLRATIDHDFNEMFLELPVGFRPAGLDQMLEVREAQSLLGWGAANYTGQLLLPDSVTAGTTITIPPSFLLAADTLPIVYPGVPG